VKITVKLFGTLRRLSNPETPGLWQGEAPEGMTLRELIGFLGTRETEVAAAAIDRRPVELDEVIQDGAVVMLVTHVGGGSTRPSPAEKSPVVYSRSRFSGH
jgi:molybdopterin converting factor small subunit